ncbi:hypothetical protein MRB53_037507 [Persea americana]|nr:hypothetical protein MRB53_037507 [Persea americana]
MSTAGLYHTRTILTFSIPHWRASPWPFANEALLVARIRPRYLHNWAPSLSTRVMALKSPLMPSPIPSPTSMLAAISPYAESIINDSPSSPYQHKPWSSSTRIKSSLRPSQELEQIPEDRIGELSEEQRAANEHSHLQQLEAERRSSSVPSISPKQVLPKLNSPRIVEPQVRMHVHPVAGLTCTARKIDVLASG